MDQLYRSTNGSPDRAGEGTLTGGPGDGSPGGGVMGSLPRRRLQRRSALRSRDREPVKVHRAGAGVPSPSAADARRPHLAAVGGGQATATRPRRHPAQRSRLPAPKEPAPGIGRLALDGAVETAKLPLRLAEHLTRQALVSVTRGLRRD